MLATVFNQFWKEVVNINLIIMGEGMQITLGHRWI